MSLQWGAWARAGMASSEASTAARMERMGMGLIPVNNGLSALADAIKGSTALLAAVPFRWPAFLQAMRKPIPQLFEEHVVSQPTLAPSNARAAAAVDMSATQARVEDTVSSILGIPVSVNEPLMAAGLDSLGAVELRNSLEGSFGMQLPSTLVFDYPTISALSVFMAAKLGKLAPHLDDAPPAELVPATGRQSSSLVEIVIAGTAWRSPQAALSMASPVDAVGLVPFDRWDLEKDPLAARFGAYLRDVAGFDAAAFGLADAEAALLDPQQRLLLETVGETVLGFSAASIPGKARGIYVGE